MAGAGSSGGEYYSYLGQTLITESVSQGETKVFAKCAD